MDDKQLSVNGVRAERRQGSRLHHLRSAILMANDMCGANYVQTDTEMRKRAAAVQPAGHFQQRAFICSNFS